MLGDGRREGNGDLGSGEACRGDQGKAAAGSGVGGRLAANRAQVAAGLSGGIEAWDQAVERLQFFASFIMRNTCLMNTIN
ncbi:uncharacterized protein A4U43_C05F13260 [Asparagus officinalis]|uniref:Uncharacterized protein n=1 Tax=Asparagus officinalis TaxID=4686 RepID=A0A5P1EWR1_ASPOF|nr:uncharacterized protein A4U43_C05F13260 [Asparagus officinalis]